MAATAAPVSSIRSQIRSRSALVASGDGSFRQRLNSVLTGLRWQVREAGGGAEAWGEAMDAQPQVIIVDSWLPDLDRDEFLREFHSTFPGVDVITYLIIAQRAFEANSKAVTTFDTITQETINMIH